MGSLFVPGVTIGVGLPHKSVAKTATASIEDQPVFVVVVVVAGGFGICFPFVVAFGYRGNSQCVVIFVRFWQRQSL